MLLGPLEAAVEQQVDFGLQMALRHGQRLKGLIDALLDLSLIDAGRVDPVLLPIDIAALTSDIASLFHGAAALAGVKLTVDCPALPQPVPVDRAQWEQIVIHLLGNAIRFAPSGEVCISLRAQVGSITLEVSDKGRGISPADLPHLFERFHAVRNRDGGGLGLALVRELVRMHGGDVEARGSPGQGTLFRVRIPMLGKPAPAVPHRHVADPLMRIAGSRPVDAVAGAPPPLAGPPVDTAAAVPGMRERIMRRLRALPHGAVVPVLLLSSDTRASVHADAIEAGADDVIGKPFAATELLARVSAHMRLSAERRALHHEGALALAHAATLQQELLHRLARSQEDERRRIARELHDSLGQYLTALNVALTLLAPAIGDPHLRSLVTRLDTLTTEVDRELDDIIAALRPMVLDELGLVGALPGIVADWSRQSGIAAEALLVQVGDERFDDESESTLFRVTQESLTNVVKHARANKVAVTLTRLHDELHLSVEDDGVGFDVNLHGTGWGLRGMAERARNVGGLLQVESSPDAGTTVLVRLPCRPRGPTSAALGPPVALP